MEKIIDAEQLLQEFHKVAELSDTPVPIDNVSIEILSAPHTPPSKLPPDKMAVYVFLLGDRCLKVGKAGFRSNARYAYQHYNPDSSNSNLAKSILKNRHEIGLMSINSEEVGSWIKQNTDRVNFLLDKQAGIPILNLLEAFLQCKLKPIFEGFPAQR